MRDLGAPLDAAWPDADADAAILFTSGSTGPAKGAVYTHRQMSAMFTAVGDTLQLDPERGLVGRVRALRPAGPRARRAHRRPGHGHHPSRRAHRPGCSREAIDGSRRARRVHRPCARCATSWTPLPSWTSTGAPRSRARPASSPPARRSPRTCCASCARSCRMPGAHAVRDDANAWPWPPSISRGSRRPAKAPACAWAGPFRASEIAIAEMDGEGRTTGETLRRPRTQRGDPRARHRMCATAT